MLCLSYVETQKLSSFLSNNGQLKSRRRKKGRRLWGKRRTTQSRRYTAKKPNPLDWSSLSLWYTSNSVTQIKKSPERAHPPFLFQTAPASTKALMFPSLKLSHNVARPKKKKLRISWRLLRIYRDVESRTMLGKEREKEH